jgi:excisionase family DNA binding protein
VRADLCNVAGQHARWRASLLQKHARGALPSPTALASDTYDSHDTYCIWVLCPLQVLFLTGGSLRVKTIEAASVKPSALDRLDAIAQDMSKEDGQLGVVLTAIADTMRAGSDVVVATESDLTSPAKAARMLGMSRTHLYKLLDAGEIPYVGVGRDRRISFRDLARFESSRAEAAKDLAERFARANDYRSRAMRDARHR